MFQNQTKSEFLRLFPFCGLNSCTPDLTLDNLTGTHHILPVSSPERAVTDVLARGNAEHVDTHRHACGDASLALECASHSV